MFIRDTVAEHPVRWTYLADGRYRVRLNISKFAERRFLPSGTWKFLAKLDSNFIDERVPIPAFRRDRFIDVNGYCNGNDVLLVTDLLITDYSSIVFEFSLLDRPMVFFANDEEIFSAVRGFHRPYKNSAPGKVCHTFDELVEAISNDDFEIERVADFRAENFDVIDTHSSDRLIDWLILGDPPASSVGAAPINTAETSVGTDCATSEICG